MDYLGNRELLKQLKTAFLASGTIAPDEVLHCYDWATDEHEGCVVSGFSSKLEQADQGTLIRPELRKETTKQNHKGLCDQGAGFRQLARITGISYGIIQRVVTDQSPLICART